MRDQEYEREDRLEATHWWYAGMRKVYQTWLDRFYHANGRCLDVGSGTGGMLPLLSRYGNFVCVDYSRRALAYARVKNPIYVAVQADGVQLPFQAKSFELITAYGVIEHIEDDTQFVRECSRVLAPGGSLMLMTSAYQLLWSEHDEANLHKRRYTRRAIELMLRKSGFEIVHTSYINTAIFPGVLLVRLFQRLTTAVLVKNRDPQRTLWTVPRTLNSFLVGLLNVEGVLSARIRLPFGVGIVAYAQRPA